MEIPSVNIKDILEAETTLTYKDDLMIGREPTAPDNVTTIFDTPDRGSQLTNEKNDSKETNRYEYASVQVRVRNNRYDKAMQLAAEITDVLHGRGNEIINNTDIKLIRALDSPSLLDWDDNDRARVVVNFEVQHSPK